jgi:hypothetical protein
MCTNKPIIELDGTTFSTLEGFAEAFSRVALADHAWHGNLDAFNDILRGGFGTPDGGFILRWINSGVSRERLGYVETIRQLEELLIKCHPSNRTHITEELEAARAGLGHTVFDWLVEIIESHGEGGEESEDGVELDLR